MGIGKLINDVLRYGFISIVILSFSLSPVSGQSTQIGAKYIFSTSHTQFAGSWYTIDCSDPLHTIPFEVAQGAVLNNIAELVDFGHNRYWKVDRDATEVSAGIQPGTLQFYLTAEKQDVMFMLTYKFALLIPQGKTLKDAIGCRAY